MTAETRVSAAPDVRPAVCTDVPLLLTMIGELAEYERAGHKVRATENQLQATLFGDRPAAFCHVAEVGDEVVGFALWFLNFSTWTGAHGIYLEDLYVRPQRRAAGVGSALLRELAAVCVDRGYPRLEWSVLDWNVDARGFYVALGAEARGDWVPYRVSGAALADLADGRTGPRRQRPAG